MPIRIRWLTPADFFTEFTLGHFWWPLAVMLPADRFEGGEMPQVRMIGLVLFITAVLLALAAAATKTTHIRIQTLPSSTVNPTLVSPAAPANPGVSLPDTDPRFEPHQPLPVESPVDHQAEQQIQFTSVPVMWPLLGAGCLGMILWFFQPSERNRKQLSSRRRR